MRVVGLDIHRVFAEAVMLEDGTIRRLGRVGMTRDHLAAFARTLTHDDHVVVEATGNASAVAEVIRPHVGRVVIANPRQVRLIAEARIKTDVIDATVLARLYASGFLPEVWIPDEATLGLRRQVTRRTQIVRQRARLKTIVQSILHAHLVPPCPHADLFGPRGRAWLLAQALPPDEGDATSVTPIERIASATVRPCAVSTSTCRSLATISSGLCRFLDIDPSSSWPKAIPQGGPLQRGQTNC